MVKTKLRDPEGVQQGISSASLLDFGTNKTRTDVDPQIERKRVFEQSISPSYADNSVYSPSLVLTKDSPRARVTAKKENRIDAETGSETSQGAKQSGSQSQADTTSSGGLTLREIALYGGIAGGAYLLADAWGVL